MKNLKDIVIEKLCHQQVDEKLVINKDSKLKQQYTCQPKDRFELKSIITQRLTKDKNADLNDIDVSEITDMHSLFRNLDPHNIHIEDWDVRNVTNMVGTFVECENFDCDLSKWDVRNVINAKWTFGDCTKFTGNGLENWKLDNVRSTEGMFEECKNLNVDLEKWVLPKCIYMDDMFEGCDSLKNIPSWYKS